VDGKRLAVLPSISLGVRFTITVNESTPLVRLFGGDATRLCPLFYWLTRSDMTG
jgi:hypothetical protein